MKNQYDLCLEVLSRFQKTDVLKEIVVIGSWCIYFYRNYFSDKTYSSSIRTRDIDFLVPIPTKLKKKTDIPEMLKDLGFIEDFHRKGLIRLNHPELIIEFLVPERGRGRDTPYPLPELGINAQALRFLDFLIENTMELEFNDLRLKLPHPAAFGLHKLIISTRRIKEDKRIKERQEAIRILRFLIMEGEDSKISNLFESMPRRWRTKVIDVLKESEEKSILNILI
jgi:hypothetical protein